MLEPILPGEPASSGEPDIRYHVPIREWDKEERPREKLMARGPQALTEAELIALIFGHGTRTKQGSFSAVQLGQALLRTYGSLGALAKKGRQQLERVTGIGPAKAAQLLAAFEIGRRVEAHAEGERLQVTGPADVAAAYGPRLRELKREVFMVVFLNTAGIVTGDAVISEGGLAASIVEPRAVFQRAVLENAASIVCLHNHPSGNPEPSREDVQITKQLVEAGKMMGIPVHDHLIIAGRSYTSLAERGLM